MEKVLITKNKIDRLADKIRELTNKYETTEWTNEFDPGVAERVIERLRKTELMTFDEILSVIDDVYEAGRQSVIVQLPNAEFLSI